MKLKDFKLNKLVKTHVVYMRINEKQEHIHLNNLPTFIIKKFMKDFGECEIAFRFAEKVEEIFIPDIYKVVTPFVYITVFQKEEK